MIVPKQHGTPNTVQTLHEEELIMVQEKHNLITLGWIHTHPSQSCFLSSVDMHCQLSYQIMMPNAIAIVYAPRHTTKAFSLTKKGVDALAVCFCFVYNLCNTTLFSLCLFFLLFCVRLSAFQIVQKCSCQGFHRHEGVKGIYEEAKHARFSKKHRVTFIDLRYLFCGSQHFD